MHVRDTIVISTAFSPPSHHYSCSSRYLRSEKETCDQEEKLNKIRPWKARPAEHLEVTTPQVNPEYAHFKANKEAKAAAAAAKASKAT